MKIYHITGKVKDLQLSTSIQYENSVWEDDVIMDGKRKFLDIVRLDYPQISMDDIVVTISEITEHNDSIELENLEKQKSELEEKITEIKNKLSKKEDKP